MTPRRSVRRLAAPLFAAPLLAAAVAAQDLPRDLPPEFAAREPSWEITTSLFYSDPPGSEDRLTPIVYADRAELHVEVRYNYEDLETLSAFVGWNFDVEGQVSAAITPMLGVVVGDTDGLAPALEFDVGWRRLAWYAESEYLVDKDDNDDNFFYSWSTLTYGLTDWLAAGVVAERSKLVDTDFSVQRGLALEIAGQGLGLSLYTYNVGSDDSYTVVALELVP